MTKEVAKMHAGLKVVAEMPTVVLGATTASARAIEDTQAIPTRHVTHVSTRTTAFAIAFCAAARVQFLEIESCVA